MVYEVCLHGYARRGTRINKWFTFRSSFTWMYTNKQMVYVVCLHGYARINKWFMRFVYMDMHE